MEISYESASDIIPKDLYNFLAWLITDIDISLCIIVMLIYHISLDKDKVTLGTKIHERVVQIAQDLIAAVTSLPTPRHIGLALHDFRQTRSKNLVTILNRYGHCISYDDAQRYITAIADNADEIIGRDGVFIPQDLKHRLFIQCALDNFTEDRKDGQTMHATSNIFINTKVIY